MSSGPSIAANELTRFASELIQAAGVSSAEAGIVAESLVAADLRGHASHGVLRIPGYVRQIVAGEIVADADLEVVCETASVVGADAHFGFGQVQMLRLIERLEPKARGQGVVCGTLKNCGHVGRLGEWVERTAEAGLAGLISVNDNGVLQCVAPPGGTSPRISTNPVAIGVPTGDGPLVLDISTSAVANGKIKIAHLSGEQCPEGWLQDADGNATTDPAVRFTDPCGTILPMGGEQGYKGFGLGLLFDILVGGLSGGFCPPASEDAADTNNVLLILWDPDRFSGAAHFVNEADRLVDYVRHTPRKSNVEQIRLPGDRSAALLKERKANGIPIDAGTWKSLTDQAGRSGVPLPACC